GHSPFATSDRREENRRSHGRGEYQREVADECRGDVVEEAVRRQRIVARVPEVVPDERAASGEERPVEVDRRMARSRAEREQEQRSGGGERAAGELPAVERRACNGRAWGHPPGHGADAATPGSARPCNGLPVVGARLSASQPLTPNASPAQVSNAWNATAA